MSADFQYLTSPESAWKRRVRVAVVVTDAVTGEVIRDGIKVSVAGLQRQPIVNGSGCFVWLQEPGVVPGVVGVDPGDLPYLPRQLPAPGPPPPLPAPQVSVVSVVLAPTPAYPFEAGVCGVKSTLILDSTVYPPVPIVLQPPAEGLRLQWMDENQPLPGWTNAAVESTTNQHGDFAAIVRFGPGQSPRADLQGRLRLRVAVTYAGTTRFSPETAVRPGYVSNDSKTVAWNQFTNI